MAMVDDFKATMLAQVEAASDDDTLFKMLEFCNRYSRQSAADYAGPKMKDGTRVPQAIFAEVEAVITAKRAQ